MPGLLFAFEGLDQSGKQTQADRLVQKLRAAGHQVETLSFPDYDTPIGREIGLALRGERPFTPDTMQLLYVANRHEYLAALTTWLAAGVMVVCDRYRASSVAYGEAFGLDPDWLTEIQRYLPAADLTVLLDIEPDRAASRKQTDRDKYERDLALLARVRASYLRQAAVGGWAVVNGAQSRDEVATAVAAAADGVLHKAGLLT